MIGGPLVTRMRTTVTRALFLVVLFHVVSFSGYLSALFVNCDDSPWAGTVTDNGFVFRPHARNVRTFGCKSQIPRDQFLHKFPVANVANLLATCQQHQVVVSN